MENKKIAMPDIIINVFLILVSLCFIIPLAVIVTTSLMSEAAINQYGFLVLPKSIDLSSYEFLLKNPERILNGYKVSIITSVISLVIYLAMLSSCAYALSKDDFRFKKAISFYMFFTMLFHGGLAPSYIMMTKYLNLKNSYLALILPLLGGVWWLFIVRTFFQQIPKEMSESAEIDGANEFYIYVKIMLPLSKPVMATVGIMSLLGFWSSWMPALLYIEDKKLFPLQYLLQIMLRNIEQILDDMSKMPVGVQNYMDIPTEPVRMAMCILAAGPMLVIFPFFQKYFIKGMTVGSVKG